MAQAANISLPLGATLNTSGGVATVFVLTQTQNGELPTLWEAGPVSGVLLFANTISHKVTAGPANRNLQLKLVRKTVGTVSGVETLMGTNSCDLKFSFARTSTTAERLELIDQAILLLNSQRVALASTSPYF